MSSWRVLWPTIFLVASVLFAGPSSAVSLRQQAVTGGPRGPHPYLYKSVSAQRLVETGRAHQWSILFPRHAGVDSLKIIALRVEFNNGAPDTSPLTTGNGTFNILKGGDKEEANRYVLTDTVYKYDRLPHDSTYFANQLSAAVGYFSKVSRGRLVLTSSVYPSGSGSTGYAVPQSMTYYSPGGKKKLETWDEYYYRKTKGLMFFVRDALLAAGRDPATSPFAQLHRDPMDSTLRDEANRKCVILIFHAGSSYLTDGGNGGSMGRNTPSDMIDAFVDRSWFKGFKDSLKLKSVGVPVKGARDSLLLDELMMCSETSNQDGLNWGIQGILVNQVARQLGIPDLFSTSSGISAIGAFCIMDFAGYSAGNGFIPPYPSAWVRAFMGWDDVKVAAFGASSSNKVKALTTVLDRDPLAAAPAGGDTTILLVPVNGHEYYLIENRQRDLVGNDSLFKFDSTQYGWLIAQYPYNVNIDSNVVRKSRDSSRVILKVRNNDISLPASGVLVWHVDELVIRNRIAYDLVNADSLYRGVSLVEADGVSDLGITFSDIFYQAAFDYGGAEDVFPHRTEKSDRPALKVSGFGPYTAPSSKSNDGGHTWLSLSIRANSSAPHEEPSIIRDYVVVNFSDSIFIVSPSWDFLVPGWPKAAAPEKFYEPVVAKLDRSRSSSQLVLLSKSGRLYAWSADTGSGGITYGSRKAFIDRVDVLGDTIKSVDTVTFIDSIADAVGPPSAAGNMLYIACGSEVRIIPGLTPPESLFWTLNYFNYSLPLREPASTGVCVYRGDSAWAVGTKGGRIFFWKLVDSIGSLKLASQSPVCALAALRDRKGAVVSIQDDGTLSIADEGSAAARASVKVPNGIGPYTLVTGDLDRDSAVEIVVCDSRHGLWVYKQNMSLAPGWQERPSDWPSTYASSPGAASTTDDRSKLPLNTGAPALADLNRDGYLDIIVGGTNGLYAFNYKGVLLSGWPSYLDNRYWYQRGSITASPIVLTGRDRKPLVVFPSPTGERPTFRVAKILRADRNHGMVWFMNEENVLDSMWDLSKSLIDTLLTQNDSLVSPYITPGGFVDAVGPGGKRPAAGQLPPGAGGAFVSSWPITTGAPLTTSPLAAFMDGSGSSPDLFTVATNGWVYRWKLPRDILPDSLFWPQSGYDAGRSFAYGGALPPLLTKDTDPITFFNYPNPTVGASSVMFKYKFSGPATRVRLDIVTFSGFTVFSTATMGAAPAQLTGSFPDWNELLVPVKRLGPAVYRCRMEATINGKRYEKFWKLAVTR